jgi:PAS domain S-box-containing protein
LCLGLWKGNQETFYSGFIRDISERKSAEARVRKSEERLRLALLAANMGTWDWEIDERRVTWSENVYPLFGVTAQDFSGTYDGFLDLVYPLIPALVWYKNDHNEIIRANRLAAESITCTPEQIEGRSTYDLYPDEAEQYYRDDLEVLRSGHPKLGIEELYQTSSGEKRWIRTDKVPYRDPQGQVMGVLVFAQDITEARQAQQALHGNEARFRAFMDHSPVLAFMKDQEGRYIYANRSWELQTNRSQADWSGKTDDDLWPAEMAAMCRESDRWVRERHELVQEVEMMFDRNGEKRWWQVIKFPIVSPDGHRYIGGIVRDVTQFERNKHGHSHTTG